MKAQPQPKKLNVKRTSGASQTERSMIFEEQIASTSTSSERAWLLVMLGLVVLTIGLYWSSDGHGHQPAWSYQPVVDDQAVDQPVELVSRDQILTGQENGTTPRPKALAPGPTPDPMVNERLVRRVYDEVINQQQFAVMAELFADQVAYRRIGAPTTLDLASLKQELNAESTAYTGLAYSIEQITADGDWVGVDWSAVGTPRSSLTEYPLTGEPQVWSGYTIWRVADGKIVQMWTYYGSDLQPYLTDGQSGQL